MQKYSISVTSARAQNPRANEAGAQNRTGSSSEPSTVTTWPSVGEPGRMSTATMNARPRTTRMSLAWGGSHWKCRPRMTPRDGSRLVDLDERGRQAQAQLRERVRLEDLGEPAPLVAEQARPDDEDLRDRGLLDPERHRYIITRPPSTASTWPVM